MPVNTDRSLEQQAESGVITFDRAVHEGGQEIVQGVFLKFESVGEKILLGECEEADKCGFNTTELSALALFDLLDKLKEPGLIPVISAEIYAKIQSEPEDTYYAIRAKRVFELFHIKSDTRPDAESEPSISQDPAYIYLKNRLEWLGTFINEVATKIPDEEMEKKSTGYIDQMGNDRLSKTVPSL
ncbi:MAG: hypothetical protein J1E64_02235 [Acetatifactor sp.]|nr:hypothetical protein [Acetatifactor sp.]